MKLDAYASQPQYVDHLRPIWDALDPGERGSFFVNDMTQRTHRDLQVGPPSKSGNVLVASSRDLVGTGDARVALAAHGAAQTYLNGAGYNPSKDRVEVFLCPSRVAAERHGLRGRAVGCPKLDALGKREWPKRNGIPTVALAFHWELGTCPEAGSAWVHYARGLKALSDDSRFRVIGHGHPFAWRYLEPEYRKAGIEPVRAFADVLERADVLVVDNSSVLFEFAAVRGPVVLMDAPWYRHNVEHGLRFWSEADVGERVAGPGELPDAIMRALDEDHYARSLRLRAVGRAYGKVDGRASQRAVAALREVFA